MRYNRRFLLTTVDDISMPLSQQQKKRFRSIGHHLKPVVIISENGLGKGVIEETNRALEDHELIKIKLAVFDREAKHQLIEMVCQETGAELVQTIGKVALIYRPAAKPKVRLSNLLRFQEI